MRRQQLLEGHDVSVGGEGIKAACANPNHGFGAHGNDLLAGGFAAAWCSGLSAYRQPWLSLLRRPHG